MDVLKEFFRNGRLLTLALGHFMVDSYVGLLPVMFPLLIHRFDLNLRTVGLVTLAYTGMGAVSQPVFGLVADRWGTRPLMVLGRFLSVGVACALLHNAIMLGGHWLGLHYAVSTFISFGVVVLFGYSLHSTWSFPNAERGRTPFARYVLVASANLPLSLAGMFAFVDLGGLSVPLAAPLVTLLLVMFNFLGGRWALRAALWRS